MPKLNQIQIRDPFVLRDGQDLYLFGSTDPDIWKADGIGFDMYKCVSPTDLTEWEGPFAAFRPPKDFWSRRNFWAPEVHKYKGSYYMLATFLPIQGRRGTAILRTESLDKPFLPWSDGAVTPPEWEALDGTLYVDESNAPYMVFCHEWQQVGDGEICAMPLKDDLKAAEGPPFLLFKASEAKWASPLKDRPTGSYVTDGPFLWKACKDGKCTLVMLWSSFGETGNYCIGMATSESGTLKGPWRQSPEPIYSADGGHGMLFESGNGNLYLAIHTPNKTPDERAMFVRLEWDGQSLVPTNDIIK